MQLIKVGLEGYGRFREAHELDVDAPLIALIGPNEAGKTSLLKALQHLNSSGEFTSREVSRGLSSDQTRVWARYALDDSDRSRMPDEARGVRQLIVRKLSNGELDYDFVPPIRRYQPTRQQLVAAARDALPDLPPADQELTDMQRATVGLVEDAGKRLDGLHENTRDTVPRALTAGVEAIREQAASLELVALVERLDEILEYETHHPAERALDVVTARRPMFVEFTESDRTLPDTIALDDTPTRAVTNLLAMGGATWEELRAAAADRGRLRGLLKAANRQINEAMASWQQARVEVELDVDARVLQVLVKTSEDDYVAFSQRSSGLRMFVALRAFIDQEETSSPPILLIDEAETHLHYDAQADLVRVLSGQREAAGVIYSTHSAGCLPADLGTGVRAVEPLSGDGPDRSRLVANFFESEHGIRPLLIALGASTFALSLRRALFVEGISDAVLLPVLLRQVTGLHDLPFQVLPGISKAGADHARELENSAHEVAYLLDGDQAGIDRRQEMIEDWGIDPARVFLLPADSDGVEGTTLEDVLDEEVYLRSISAQVTRWNDGLTVDDLVLPARNRSESVKTWAIDKGISVPSKNAVAARVLERRRDESAQPVELTSMEFRIPLREFYLQLEAALDVPPGPATS
jgi:ABC-type transport system involved in cytochrome c biogenesis ATPase subunit